jgi:hypothetical protein
VECGSAETNRSGTGQQQVRAVITRVLLSNCVAWFELNCCVGKCSAGENGNTKEISHYSRLYPCK